MERERALQRSEKQQHLHPHPHRRLPSAAHWKDAGGGDAMDASAFEGPASSSAAALGQGLSQSASSSSSASKAASLFRLLVQVHMVVCYVFA